ncbi:MAG TPA: non-ribosomal peptide synthetase [Holophaga sp.]|nr:non-ribosomal peptide synthetase [Holophaga sp.]
MTPLLSAFNGTAAEYPSDRTIVDLFEAAAAADPGAEAVRAGGRALTYGELNALANRFAWQLKAVGARPERPVALKMEHSIEVVCAILGILKSGSAYVPIDPSNPARRVEAILGQIAATHPGETPLLVAGPGQAAGLPEGAARVVTVQPGLRGLELFRRENPAREAGPENLAYVIYTSGSTGEPKGVMIEHRSLVNYIWWAGRSYVPGPGMAWPLFSSLAFDLTVTTVFTPLVTRGRIIVYQDQAWSHGTLLLKVIEDRAVNIMKLTPAHLALVRDMDLGAMDLRTLIVGGEDLKAALAADILARTGAPVAIFNEYGPTEATVGCMIHRYDPERDTGVSVPIGVPAANMQVFPLDGELRPAGPGAEAQLFLAGAGLARGYLNRPDLTAERFPEIPDPLGSGGRVRVYRTGDLARWGEEGRLVFLGRADEQVKIGGARIELGEIEARLQAHPGVRRCAVTVVKAPGSAPDDTSGNRLAAYFEADGPLGPQELRPFLAETLPSFMLPSHFVRLERLPLTTNGKLDRGALPAPDTERPEVSAAFVEQRSETEARIAAIWRDALKLASVGVDDDFFELGGKSLPAIRILMQINRLFGVEVPVASFFANPTVAELASLVEELRGGTE